MKKFFVSFLIVVLAIFLIGCSTEPISDEVLINTYKKLVIKDFETQKAPQEENSSTLQDIFVEPALSDSIENLQLMKLNNIRRLYKEPSWYKVKIIENNLNNASLQVEARFEGDEFTITGPAKNLGPFSFDYVVEVNLKRVKNKWLISEIKPSSVK